MKKQLLSILVAGLATTSVSAQVADSVIMGAGYANQIWYSLENDEQGTAPKDNWDIAFDVVGLTASIHINTHGSAQIWIYNKGNKSVFGTALDTNGLSQRASRYNSPYAWEKGALGRYGNPANQFDLDWGVYDMNTHYVNGDSVYIIKLVNGDYKQLYIEQLKSGTFYFKYADIDGSNAVSEQVAKSTFADKSLGYYSIVNKATVNREPNKDKWDLVFMQYADVVAGMDYPVTGALTNRGVRVAQVDRQANAGTYSAWQAHSFDSVINTIGYDWKSHLGAGVYKTKDSTVYFVAVPKANGNDIWRLYFTGFASSNGKSAFTKQKLQAASVKDVAGNTTTIALYPNPSNGGNVEVAYSTDGSNNAVMLTVTDLSGKTVVAQQLNNNAGLHTFTIPANTLRSGMYIVSVSTVGGRVQQKLVIN